VVSEILDMDLHPGPISREQLQRHAPLLPDPRRSGRRRR
jgi:hypothetical protein